MIALGAVESSSLAAAFITALLGGGAWAGYRVFRTAGPEASAIGNKSLIEVNTELRTEIVRLSGVVAEQRDEITRQSAQIHEQDEALTRAEARIRAITAELNDLENRRDELGG